MSDFLKRFSVLLYSLALDFSGGNGFQDSLVDKKMVQELKSDLLPKCAKKAAKVTNAVSSKIMQSQCLPCKAESDRVLYP